MITNRVIQGNTLDVLRDFPDECVDAIITDPPYGTTACAWDTVVPFEPMWELFTRIAKPNAAIVMTASQPFTSALVMSNPGMFRYEWIWRKTKPTQFLDANRKPLKEHENILVFSKEAHAYHPQGLQRSGQVKSGKGKGGNLYGKTRPVYVQEWVNYPRSIITVASVAGGEHPTQKPVELMEYLIRTYTQPGDLVLDPFAGSGTTLVAARNLNRRYLGVELMDEYIKTAERRLSEPFTIPMFE